MPLSPREQVVWMRIDGVVRMDDATVTVIISHGGREVRLPRSQIERWGDYVWMPRWLADKIMPYLPEAIRG